MSVNIEEDEMDRETRWCMERAVVMFPEVVQIRKCPPDWIHGEPPPGSSAARTQEEPGLLAAIADVMTAVMIDECIGLLREQIAWTTTRRDRLPLNAVPGRRYLDQCAEKLRGELDAEWDRLSVLREKIEGYAAKKRRDG